MLKRLGNKDVHNLRSISPRASGNKDKVEDANPLPRTMTRLVTDVCPDRGLRQARLQLTIIPIFQTYGVRRDEDRTKDRLTRRERLIFGFQPTAELKQLRRLCPRQTRLEPDHSACPLRHGQQGNRRRTSGKSGHVREVTNELRPATKSGPHAHA